MTDKIARERIADLERQIIELRKKFSVPVSGASGAPYEYHNLGFVPEQRFVPVECFYAEDLKGRFDELYEFLNVRRCHSPARTTLFKNPSASKTPVEKQ